MAAHLSHPFYFSTFTSFKLLPSTLLFLGFIAIVSSQHLVVSETGELVTMDETHRLSIFSGGNNGVAEADEWEMVGKKGNQFVVNDQPFYVNGFNTYWLMIFAVDESTRGKVSEVFKQASSVGLTVCRTWAFNDGGWRALQKSPSVYDENVFEVPP